MVVLMVAMSFVFTNSLTRGADFSSIPLPDDLQIVPPDDSCPQEIKALSGKWGGEWYSPVAGIRPLPVVLVVEKVDGSKAQIIYAWVESSKNDKNWQRYNADVELRGKKVILSFRSDITGRKFEFYLKKLETLEGEATYNSPRGQIKNTITMKRFQ